MNESNPNLWTGIPNQEQFNARVLDVGTKQARAELEVAIAIAMVDDEASE